MNGYVKVGQTIEGKYFGQVRQYADGRTVTHYETPEYLTEEMATVDAKCWKVFHMNEESKGAEYSIDADDSVYEGGAKMDAVKVAEMIADTFTKVPDTGFKIEPLTGLMSEFKGFKVSIYMPGKFWRTFDVVKPETLTDTIRRIVKSAE